MPLVSMEVANVIPLLAAADDTVSQSVIIYALAGAVVAEAGVIIKLALRIFDLASAAVAAQTASTIALNRTAEVLEEIDRLKKT